MAMTEQAAIPILSGAFGSWRLSLSRVAMEPDALARCYDRAAPGWERRVKRLGHPAACRRLLGRVLAEMPGEGALSALDCGTGTGALGLALAEVAARPVRLDALDLSPAMLAQAGERFRQAGVPARLSCGDAVAMPYEDAAFDLVMAGHLVEHFGDPRAALGEIVRVTRPGGRVLVLLTGCSLAGLGISLAWCTHRMTRAEAAALLESAGLTDVRVIAGRGGWLARSGLALVGRRP